MPGFAVELPGCVWMEAVSGKKKSVWIRKPVPSFLRRSVTRKTFDVLSEFEFLEGNRSFKIPQA